MLCSSAIFCVSVTTPVVALIETVNAVWVPPLLYWPVIVVALVCTSVMAKPPSAVTNDVAPPAVSEIA